MHSNEQGRQPADAYRDARADWDRQHATNQPILRPGYAEYGAYNQVPRQTLGLNPAPRRKRRWPRVLVVVLVMLAACGIGASALIGGGAAAVQHSVASRTGDVTITSCGKSVVDTIEIGYKIHNSSVVTQTYLPEFNVLSGSTIVGQASDIAENIPAGGDYAGRAVGMLDDGARTGLTCKLVSA